MFIHIMAVGSFQTRFFKEEVTTLTNCFSASFCLQTLIDLVDQPQEQPETVSEFQTPHTKIIRFWNLKLTT